MHLIHSFHIIAKTIFLVKRRFVMHRESYTNRYMHSSEKVCSEKGLQVRQLKTNGIGVPIPTQVFN